MTLMRHNLVLRTWLVLSFLLIPLPTYAQNVALRPLLGPSGAVIALAQQPEHAERMWTIAAASTPTRLVTALYRSQDRGATWIPAGNDLSWLNLTALAVTRAGALFLGTNDGLYARSAAESVWRRVPLDLEAQGAQVPPSLTIRQIILAGASRTRVYVIAVENQTSPRYWLFRSENEGLTFERVLIQEPGSGSGDGVGRVVVDPADPLRLYAATAGGILLSADGGVTWLPGGLDPSLAQSMTAVAVAPGQKNTLYAARAVQDDKGVHLALAQSQDGGRAWSESAAPLPDAARPMDLQALPDGRLLLSTTVGLFIRSQDRRTWSAMDGAPGAMGAYALIPDLDRPVLQRGHQEGRREQQQLGAGRRIVPRRDLLVEIQPGHPAQEKTSQ